MINAQSSLPIFRRDRIKKMGGEEVVWVSFGECKARVIE